VLIPVRICRDCAAKTDARIGELSGEIPVISQSAMGLG
jgi:hypothetical protein